MVLSMSYYWCYAVGRDVQFFQQHSADAALEAFRKCWNADPADVETPVDIDGDWRSYADYRKDEEESDIAGERIHLRFAPGFSSKSLHHPYVEGFDVIVVKREAAMREGWSGSKFPPATDWL